MPQRKIGRYEVKDEMGRGGMATVFVAYDPLFSRDVAIKVLPREFLHNPKFRERFNREATIIASLEIQSIVPVYDFGEHDGQPYLVMRYMRGGSLHDQIVKGGMSLARTSEIISRLAPALDEAHRKKIVHRDLKPKNILFDAHDGVYLTDFGIAKLQDSTAGLTGSAIIGTPSYMSPEQARGLGNVDHRSDIYSLGVILYEMLTGEQPYKADNPMGKAIMHITEPVPRILDANPDLPSHLDDITQKAMAKDPDDRYFTASQLADELKDSVPSEQVQEQERERFEPTEVFVPEEPEVETITEAEPEDEEAELVTTPPDEVEDISAEPDEISSIETHVSPPTPYDEEVSAQVIDTAPIEEVDVPDETTDDLFVIPTPEISPAPHTEVGTYDDLRDVTPLPVPDVTPPKEQRRLPTWVWIASGAAVILVSFIVGSLMYYDEIASIFAPLFGADTTPISSPVAEVAATSTPAPTEQTEPTEQTIPNTLTYTPPPTSTSTPEPTSTSTAIPTPTSPPNFTAFNAQQAKQLNSWSLPGGVTDSFWHSNRGLLAVLLDGNRAYLMNTQNGQEVHDISLNDSGFRAIALSHDGATMAIGGDQGILLYDPSSGSYLTTIDRAGVTDLAFSSDDNFLGVAYQEAGALWNLKTSAWETYFDFDKWVQECETYTPPGQDPITNCYAVHDGTFGDPEFVEFPPDGESIVWGVNADNTGSIRAKSFAGDNTDSLATCPSCFIADIAVSAGNVIAAGSREWVFVKGTNVTEPILREHSAQVNAVDFSPEGDILASGDIDGSIILWDPYSGEPLITLNGHSRGIMNLSFSEDGTLLISTSEDGDVSLWGISP